MEGRPPFNLACHPHDNEIFSQERVIDLWNSGDDDLIVLIPEGRNEGVCIDRPSLLQYFRTNYLHGNCSGDLETVRDEPNESCQEFYREPSTNLLFHEGVKRLLEEYPEITTWVVKPNVTTATIGIRRHTSGEYNDPSAPIATLCTSGGDDGRRSICAPIDEGDHPIDNTWLNKKMVNALLQQNYNEAREIAKYKNIDYSYVLSTFLSSSLQLSSPLSSHINSKIIKWLLHNGAHISIYIDTFSKYLSDHNFDSANNILDRDVIDLSGFLIKFIKTHPDLEIIQWLLDHGADPNTKSELYYTPLIEDAQSPHKSYKITETLIEYGADVNLKYKEFTPLKMAVISNAFNKVVLLVEEGANVNEVFMNDNGNTILHYATEYANEFIVEFLFHNGANPFTKNSSGHLPFNLSTDSYIRRRLKPTSTLMTEYNNIIARRPSH